MIRIGLRTYKGNQQHDFNYRQKLYQELTREINYKMFTIDENYVINVINPDIEPVIVKSIISRYFAHLFERINAQRWFKWVNINTAIDVENSIMNFHG